MFITTDRLTRTAASADVRLSKKASQESFFKALRLTVAAVLFVVGSFFSLTADVAQAKTATKGKKALVTKANQAKSSKAVTKAKARKTLKAQATKAKTQKAIATKAQASKVKANAANLKSIKTSKAKQFTDKVRQGVSRRASKAMATVKTTAKSAAKKFSGNFALLNRYKQDLAVYGAQKLESWSKKMTGEASWYGTFFHGRLTASGRRFNKYADIAAHRSLPFGTILKVTNKDNGKSAIVEVLDRGPYVGDRLIDLSEGTAKKLGYMGTGTANVETEILKVGDMKYEVEAPLTAAELRGDVNRHQIDLASLNVSSESTAYANSAFLSSSSFGATLPELKPDMDAFASTNVVDSSELYAILNQPAATIGRA
jgi:rare lipoprotein A (peptidoglycan hydrolase)